ncbi:hypothetical protein SLS58_000721 [Diplodia intermedia]|uniref:RRM domain-containing protein n=1 Tax=Diplodia intermedia TaxID=856260 RepID=A0ABR3U4A7_9PEZI
MTPMALSIDSILNNFTNPSAMYLLRRAALRAASSTSASIAVAARPRTFTSLTPTSTFRAHQQQWLAVSQRRYNSEDANAARPSEETTTDETVTEEPSASEKETAAGNPEVESTNAEVESSSTSPLEQASEVASQAAEAVSAAGAAAATAAFGSASENRFFDVDSSQRTLYIGNLFYQTNEDQLRQEFSRFGDIVKTTIIKDPAGMSRGFGYIEYSTDEAASEAIADMNQRVLDGRRMTVQYHKKRENNSPRNDRSRSRRDIPNPPSKTLFIGNMSYEMSDRDLNELFRDIRNVLDVRVAIDRRTGQPRGFAHADFMDETSATKAMELLQEKEIYGRRLRIDYTSQSATRSQ